MAFRLEVNSFKGTAPGSVGRMASFAPVAQLDPEYITANLGITQPDGDHSDHGRSSSMFLLGEHFIHENEKAVHIVSRCAEDLDACVSHRRAAESGWAEGTYPFVLYPPKPLLRTSSFLTYATVEVSISVGFLPKGYTSSSISVLARRQSGRRTIHPLIEIPMDLLALGEGVALGSVSQSLHC